MVFYQRKSPRLANYDYSSNGLYFITFCTENKENTLSKVVGGGVFDAPEIVLSEIGMITKRQIESINKTSYAKVIHFVVMPNHVHMLLQIESAPSHGNHVAANAAIPHIMSTLKRFIHRQSEKTVFQRSYHDHVVRTEEDFLRIWEYIDTNPQKWQQDRYFTE